MNMITRIGLGVALAGGAATLAACGRATPAPSEGASELETLRYVQQRTSMDGDTRSELQLARLAARLPNVSPVQAVEGYNTIAAETVMDGDTGSEIRLLTHALTNGVPLGDAITAFKEVQRTTRMDGDRATEVSLAIGRLEGR